MVWTAICGIKTCNNKQYDKVIVFLNVHSKNQLSTFTDTLFVFHIIKKLSHIEFR
jgi:hypothetical protein